MSLLVFSACSEPPKPVETDLETEPPIKEATLEHSAAEDAAKAEAEKKAAEDAAKAEQLEDITLVPMGAARLRISAFPTTR